MTDISAASHDQIRRFSDAHYFGHNRAHFSLINWPRGPVRGGVVICPPLGYEAVNAHQTLRLIAERLADDGLVAMRIDYAGSGNSIGSARDTDRVAAWEQTVSDAIAELAAFGLAEPAVLGIRFGALLAVKAAARNNGVRAAVLCDAVVDGRRYGRMMKLMAASGATSRLPSGDDGVAVAGIEFTAETLKDMGRLKITAADLGLPTLIIKRSEQSDDSDWPGPEDAALAPTVLTVPGLPALLDVDAEEARVPAVAVSQIVGWLDDAFPPSLDPAPAKPNLTPTTTETRGTATLEHTAVRFGPSSLFAIKTIARGVSARSAILMTNNGVAPNVGPGRAWIEWAGDLAAAGHAVVRLDMSGLGESPARPGRPEQVVYSREVVNDISDSARYLRELGAHHVTVIGLCSGAMLGFRAVIAGVPIDQIISINPRLDSPVAYYRTDLPHEHRLLPRIIAIPLSKTPLLAPLERVPAWVWRGLEHLHLVRSPARLPLAAVAADVPTLMIFGGNEWGLRALRSRAPRQLRELESAPRLEIAVLPELDHSMFDLNARPDVEKLVRARLDEAALGSS